MADPGWARVATLKTPEAFRLHLEAGGIPLAFDDALVSPSGSPLARPLEADGLRAGNRFCILPMEGWDGTADGHPTRADPEALAELRPLGGEAHLGRGGGRRAPRRPGEPLPARDRRSHLGVPGAPARRPRRGPRVELRQGRGERPRGRPPDHALGPLRAPERVGPAGAARRLRPPGPGPPVPRRRAHPDRRGARPPRRGLRPGRRSRAEGRVPVRGREALPRLPRPRDPRRPRPARPLRRQPGEPDPLPAHGRRGHRRRGPGPARRGSLLRLRHRALPEGRVRPGRARAGRRGLHLGLRPPARRAARRRARREPRVPAPPARPRHPLGLHERGQPLLQPARAAARACSRRATATCPPRTPWRASRARSGPPRS